MSTRKFLVDNQCYYFNFRTFNDLFHEKSTLNKVTKTRLEVELAENLNLSSNAIHNWRYQLNGPSDIEKIQEIAMFFGIHDCKLLLIERKEDLKMNKLNDNQLISLKRIYDSILDYLEEFIKSNGFNDYWFDLEGSPKSREGTICDMAISKIEKVILIFKKEYVFLKNSKIYNELEEFIYNDLYNIFDRKISYGYRFEAPVDGNPTTYDDYYQALNKLNSIIDNYIE